LIDDTHPNVVVGRFDALLLQVPEYFLLKLLRTRLELLCFSLCRSGPDRIPIPVFDSGGRRLLFDPFDTGKLIWVGCR
jgi:hypothetical protein